MRHLSKTFRTPGVGPAWGWGLLVAVLAFGVRAASLHMSFDSAAAMRRAGARLDGPVRFVPGVAGNAAEFAGKSVARLAVGDWFNPRAGTIRFRVRPAWAGSEGKRHAFLHMQQSGQVHLTIFKTGGGTLVFVYRGSVKKWFGVHVPIRNWAPGEWHTVEAAWKELAPGRLLLKLVVDGRSNTGIGAVPFASAPRTLVLGGRAPGIEPADAAVDELRIDPRCRLPLPVVGGPKPPVAATIDVAHPVGPFHRIYDFTTPWNSKSNPLPIHPGDAYWRRFKEAQFRWVRLVAFSESWLWGVGLSRDAQGRLGVDYSTFDRWVDTFRSAGAEPYLRLAYHMPALLSSVRSTAAKDRWRVQYSPPRDRAEWDGLMRAIVQHCKEKKFGIRYYVASLNEADLAVLRGAADWREICKLYAETAAVVKQVDPQARCGGPALAYDPRRKGGPLLREFVRYCRAHKAPLDFVCFHAYRKAFPFEYEQIVNRVRAIVREESPGVRTEPEYFLDEFNLWSQDRTQDNEFGAAYITAAEHFMRRAGISKVGLVSFNHFLPTHTPARELVRRKGPFPKEPGRLARFIAADLTADGVVRRGILSHPPRGESPGAYTDGRWRVALPQTRGIRLSFFTGLAIRRHPRMDGVTFQILVSAGGAWKTVFHEHQARIPWRAHSVDLAEFAGRTIRIEFRTLAGPPGSTTVADWGAWGEPRVLAGDNRTPSVVFDFVQRIDEAETGAKVPEYRFKYTDDTIRRYGLPLLKGPVVTAPYFALFLHSRLRKNALKVRMPGRGGILPDNAAGLIATGDKTGAAVLAWTFDLGWNKKRAFDFTFTGFPPGALLRVTRRLIDSTHSNPYYDYVIVKKPDNHGAYNLESGRPDVVEQAAIRADSAGRCRVRFALEPLAVTLVEVEKAEKARRSAE